MDKQCILAEKICTDCGECHMCDLDKTKICDNCSKCIDEVGSMRSLNVSSFYKNSGSEK